jgi:hypothetical protein
MPQTLQGLPVESTRLRRPVDFFDTEGAAEVLIDTMHGNRDIMKLRLQAMSDAQKATE